jgi:ubiquinone/menaquinone biosynthesis C-methylase UbiE
MSKGFPQPEDVAEWYNHRYATGQEQAFGRPPRESRDRLERLKLKKSGLKILDVGAGQGYFVREAELLGHEAIGIDIAYEGALIGQALSQTAAFAVADGQRLPFADGVFDVVSFWGTLEHHPNMALAIQECKRVLKKDGLAAFRVPNRDFWVYRVFETLGMKQGTEQQEMIEHLLSQAEWQKLFEDGGFKLLSVQADNWFVRSSIFEAQGLVPRLKMLMRKFSIGLAPLPYTYVFDFVCQPL